MLQHITHVVRHMAGAFITFSGCLVSVSFLCVCGDWIGEKGGGVAEGGWRH